MAVNLQASANTYSQVCRFHFSLWDAGSCVFILGITGHTVLQSGSTASHCTSRVREVVCSTSLLASGLSVVLNVAILVDMKRHLTMVLFIFP